MTNKKRIIFIGVISIVVVLSIITALAFGGVFGNVGKGTPEQKVDFGVQYIRTNGYHEEVVYPVLTVIRSAEELSEYYDANKDRYDLQRKSEIFADTTMGFLDACDKYNDEYFQNNNVIMVLLEEGSGSIRHNVDFVKIDTDAKLQISIRSILRGAGTCDMAEWHIMIEIPKDKTPENKEDILLHYNNILQNKDHEHKAAKVAQTVKNPVSGYCGNTMTTIYFDDDEKFTFMSGNSVTMTDILANLDYDKEKICKCLPQYRVDTEFGTNYGINITEGFVRCDKGQAELTQIQIDKLKEIILWARYGGDWVDDNIENFSFSLTWDVYGISSYDSKTGTLIKTKDATNPKDYTTHLELSIEEWASIWKLIKELDIESYPDEYNPHGNGVSTPYMTLILSVKTGDTHKTVTVPETVLSYETNDEKGQKFLDTCKGIRDILIGTEEWKSLPDYEFLYD